MYVPRTSTRTLTSIHFTCSGIIIVLKLCQQIYHVKKREKNKAFLYLENKLHNRKLKTSLCIGQWPHQKTTILSVQSIYLDRTTDL